MKNKINLLALCCLTAFGSLVACGKKSSEPTDDNPVVDPADDEEINPYTEEEIPFGKKIFGEKILRANASGVGSKQTMTAKIESYNFKSYSRVDFEKTTIPHYALNSSEKHPFTLIDGEDHYTYRISDYAEAKCDEVGGVIMFNDTKAGKCYTMDGFGNVLGEFSSTYAYVSIESADFFTGRLAHDFGEECKPVEYLVLTYKFGSSASSATTSVRYFAYEDKEVVDKYIDDSFLCDVTSFHVNDDVNEDEFGKTCLSAYGKEHLYYVDNDGLYRFYDEEGNIISSYAVSPKGCEEKYTTSWFCDDHLCSQITYETKDDDNYTFFADGKYYQTNQYIFEYETGKLFKVNKVNYVVLNATSMLYTNTYSDITYITMSFINNLVLEQYERNYLIDKNYILHDDVTHLISSKIVKTANYYYSTDDLYMNVFNLEGKHIARFSMDHIGQIYPINEMIGYTNEGTVFGFMNFEGKHIYNSVYAECPDPALVDGYTYIPVKTVNGGLDILRPDSGTIEYTFSDSEINAEECCMFAKGVLLFASKNMSLMPYQFMSLVDCSVKASLNKTCTISNKITEHAARGVYDNVYIGFKYSDSSYVVVKGDNIELESH